MQDDRSLFIGDVQLKLFAAMVKGHLNIVEFTAVVKIVFNTVGVCFNVRLPEFTELTMFNLSRGSRLQMELPF
jgi:hypothetical protein